MRLDVDQRVRKFLCPEHRQLLEQTLQVLVDEDLEDVAQALCERAMPPDCRLARVMDLPHELTDFMQLLLRELQWVATVPGWTPMMRRARAHEALELAGFSKNEE